MNPEKYEGEDREVGVYIDSANNHNQNEGDIVRIVMHSYGFVSPNVKWYYRESNQENWKRASFITSDNVQNPYFNLLSIVGTYHYSNNLDQYEIRCYIEDEDGKVAYTTLWNNETLFSGKIIETEYEN